MTTPEPDPSLAPTRVPRGLLIGIIVGGSLLLGIIVALVVVFVIPRGAAPAERTQALPTPKPTASVAAPSSTPTVAPAAPVEPAPAAPAPAKPKPAPAPAPAAVVGITSFTVTPNDGKTIPASCAGVGTVPVTLTWTSSGLLPELELQQWGSYSSFYPDWQGLPSNGSAQANFPCTQVDWELLASDGTTRYTAKLILKYDGTSSWAYVN